MKWDDMSGTQQGLSIVALIIVAFALLILAIPPITVVVEQYYEYWRQFRPERYR